MNDDLLSLIVAALAITLLVIPLSALAGMGTSLLLHLSVARMSRRLTIGAAAGAGRS